MRGVQMRHPGWTQMSLYGYRYRVRGPEVLAPPAIRVAPQTDTTTTTIGADAAIVNTITGTTTNTNTNTNTNIVIVRPNYPTGYGGYPYGAIGAYGYQRYPYRATYRYFDRGIFNAMPGPFGLSSLRPLQVTTIP
jgi:hypothetical protein